MQIEQLKKEQIFVGVEQKAPKFPLDLALEIFPPIKDPKSIPKGPPKEKPTIPPIKLPQIDIRLILNII